MMRRPRAYVLVTVWLGVFAFFSVLSTRRVLEGTSGAGSGSSAYATSAYLVLLVGVPLFIIGLVRMHPVAMWVGVACAGYSAMSFLVRLPAAESQLSSPVVVAILVGAAGLNAASAWYLSRPNIRVVATRFRAEREQEAMRRFSERQIRKAARR